MKMDEQVCGKPFRIRWLGALGIVATFLAPVCAQAQSASPLLTKAPPGGGYVDPGPIGSWLDMVSATQAAQPSWMTPLVTVTPRLEQEFRFDFYSQQNAAATSPNGNGQHLDNYGGPGGARIEFIPAYNWEVIVASPSYETASGPKGAAQGLGRLARISCQISIHFCERAERRLYRHRLPSRINSARHAW
jgi:hypothetical protein